MSLQTIVSGHSAGNSDQVPRELRQSWVNVLSHLDPKYGGLSAVVPELSAAISTDGRVPVTVAGFCASGENYRPCLDASVILQHWPVSRRKWDARLRAGFRDLISRSAGVHVHGLWQYSTALACGTSRALGKPYILSAHGMLEAWALRNKRWKKLLYAALVERKNVHRAACLHALTTQEAEDYRRFGAHGPIAVVPNGVHVPADVSADPFFARFPELQGRQLVLFLGRIHFKKGLDLLCQAWARVAVRFPDAHLVLAGPDFEGTLAQVQNHTQRLGLTSRVTFTGMLSGDLKWSALRSAHCFVLPSYSEGLSVSTLEAMGMGVPVVITRQCNLPDVAENGCGYVIEAEVAPLEESLEHVLSCPATSWLRMARAGQALVEERYSWDRVGEQMADVYRWVAAGQPSYNAPLSVLPGETRRRHI